MALAAGAAGVAGLGAAAGTVGLAASGAVVAGAGGAAGAVATGVGAAGIGGVGGVSLLADGVSRALVFLARWETSAGRMFSAPETKVAPGAAAWALRIAGALLAVTGGVGAAEAGTWVAGCCASENGRLPSRPSLMAKIVETRANMPAMPAISQRTVCTAESGRGRL